MMEPLREITRKVVSYCDIPEELTEKHWLSENQPDVYVPFSVSTKEEQLLYNDKISSWILENYPETEGTTVFVHIDY